MTRIVSIHTVCCAALDGLVASNLSIWRGDWAGWLFCMEQNGM